MNQETSKSRADYFGGNTSTPIGADPAPARLLLRPKETAAALGLSERKLWSLTAGGEIPSVRIGRAVRYHVADLAEWIHAHKQNGGR